MTDSGLYSSNEKNGCWTTVYNPKKMKGVAVSVVATETGVGGSDDNHDNNDSDSDEETGGAVTKYNSNRKQPILSGKCFL